jgi:hypothetical protein
VPAPPRNPPIALATAISVIAGYAFGVRPRMLRWGATDDEVRRPYPGADLVPGGKRGATMAATINAPPSVLWLWLIQMGCNRAGWYSWDRLDNGGVPSARRIHPEWQHIAVGDHLDSLPSGNAWFQVAAFQPGTFLALRASFDLRGRPFAPNCPRPRYYTDSVWCFLLQELPGERTRLVVSGYTAARPKVLQAILDFVFWEPAHWIMQTRQFTNLQRRTESRPVHNNGPRSRRCRGPGR